MTPEEIRDHAKNTLERLGKDHASSHFLEEIIDLTYKYEDLKADYDHARANDKTI